MKFVYFGYDFMLGCVRRLLDNGHELIGIFTFPCDNIFNFNQETYNLAQSLGIFVKDTPVQAEDIKQMIDSGVRCFLSAGYPYKIPPIDEGKAYGINIHPSYLPKGRGLMPTPTIIMKEPEAAGVTIHKLSQAIDEGDILDQKRLPLNSKETVESYSSRVALQAPDMIADVFSNLDSYWQNAFPQKEEEASLFPAPDDATRLLDWNSSLETLDKKARAFGRFGCLGHIGQDLWIIYDHDVWEEQHDYPFGTCVLDMPQQKVIAVPDGFFLMKQGELTNT